MSNLSFPNNFVWGAATSAYQIEGGANMDGRGESIWDRFAHTPGKTLYGATGDVACDHYHRWPEDVALMADIGLKAYRFSAAWPRILPAGWGQVNPVGLDFYSRLVDGLLEKGITPFLTLYHWDLPQPLEDRGGWPNRFTAECFAEYADQISRRLGDRVTNWITHNEPWCASMLGYQEGVHAPGRQDWPAAIQASHHLLLSHGLAVRAIRANVPGAQIGPAINFEPATPASPSPADYHAARLWDGYYFRWFLDPLFGRHYPADMVAHYAAQGYLPDGMSFVQEGDMATIAAPLDFLGVNNYTRYIARDEQAADNLPVTVQKPPREELTEMEWEVHPPTFYNLLNRLHFEYQVPRIYVTENGCSYRDMLDDTGRVRDEKRIQYLTAHIQAMHRAIANGAPVAGYFVWSLLDNYEWARGYEQWFGLVHVDYATQKRTLKDSAYWYKQVIAANTLPAGV